MTTEFTLHEVWLQVRVAGGVGVTQTKRWFFETRSWFGEQDDWLELLHRILYDVNVAKRRRDPTNPTWFALDQVRVGTVDAAAALAWDGFASLESGQRHLPWMLSDAVREWEPAVCFFVHPTSRAYQTLPAPAFTRLIALRARQDGTLDDAGLATFLDKVDPGQGASHASRWESELSELRTVPPTKAFRLPAGAERSGPPLAKHLR